MWWGTGYIYLHSLKEFSYKILINHKGENSNSMVKKTGGHHWNRVTKVNITNNGTSWHHVPPDMMHWEEHRSTYVVFLPKEHDLNLIMREEPDTNPNVETFFFFKLIYLLIYFWPRWVFIAAHRLSLVAASGGYSSLWCAGSSHCNGFSCCGAWALGARASVVVARRLSSCASRALERRLSSCGAQA